MRTQNQEFIKLRKLLALKRNERPPPGYFDTLRENVIDRLEAEELVEYSSWWRWLIEKFDAKPILVCAYGFVVSGLLLAGFRLSQLFENEVAATPIFTGPWLAVTPGSSPSFLEEFESNNSSDTYPSAIETLSKSSQSIFTPATSPIRIQGARGLQAYPIGASAKSQ